MCYYPRNEFILVKQKMPTELAKEIARRLKAARKAAGYKTARDFGSSHSIPPSTYAQHETGKRSINAELIINYSELLQVNPYWLLTGSGEPYFGTINYEKKATISQENFSISQPFLQESNQSEIFNVALLKKILFLAKTLFNDKSIPLSYEELINYCFDIYNIISTLTANETEKEKIINLTFASLKRGAAPDTNLIKDKMVG